MIKNMSARGGSASGGKITKIQAREILDSRGNPTVETTVWAGNASAKASVPSGASTGIHEAWELRDGNKKRYGGKGVLKAVKNVNQTIAKALKGLDVAHQQDIDQIMIDLDGTPNKSNLGANAILSVSLASIRLAAKLAQKPLFSYIGQQYHYKPKGLPTPLFNVINGGKHADSGLDIQEFFIIPLKGSFKDKLRKGDEVFQVLKNQLAKEHKTVSVGDEGGFAPKLESNEEALKQLVQAVKAAGFKLGKDFMLGMDAAASEFFDAKKNLYELKASKLSLDPKKIYRLYAKWAEKYHLQILEDGCGEDDFSGWKILTRELGRKLILVGDDLFVTNPKRIALGVAQKMANAALIKVNQIGTLTETMQAIRLAQAHKYKIIISHRSGETDDDFIADLAVAVNAEFIKAGAPDRGERVSKYNRLMEIETQM
jgi:enolase